MRKSFTVSMIAIIFITFGCGGGGGVGQASSAAIPFSSSVSVSTAFTAGISHIDGKYRFTQNNYLLEGAAEAKQRVAVNLINRFCYNRLK